MSALLDRVVRSDLLSAGDAALRRRHAGAPQELLRPHAAARPPCRLPVDGRGRHPAGTNDCPSWRCCRCAGTTNSRTSRRWWRTCRPSPITCTRRWSPPCCGRRDSSGQPHGGDGGHRVLGALHAAGRELVATGCVPREHPGGRIGSAGRAGGVPGAGERLARRVARRTVLPSRTGPFREARRTRGMLAPLVVFFTSVWPRGGMWRPRTPRFAFPAYVLTRTPRPPGRSAIGSGIDRASGGIPLRLPRACGDRPQSRRCRPSRRRGGSRVRSAPEAGVANSDEWPVR